MRTVDPPPTRITNESRTRRDGQPRRIAPATDRASDEQPDDGEGTPDVTGRWNSDRWATERHFETNRTDNGREGPRPPKRRAVRRLPYGQRRRSRSTTPV